MRRTQHYSLRRQLGMTMVELLITTGVLMMIITMGVTITNNVNGSLKLSQQESKMQQYAREAIRRMSLDLRQAENIRLIKPPSGEAHVFNVYLTVPEFNSNGAPSDKYSLIRYWYDEDPRLPGSGIKSLFRAIEKDQTSDTVPSTYSDTVHLTTGQTRLLPEAAAQNPGHDSYFYYDSSRNTLEIVMIATTYTIDKQASTAAGVTKYARGRSFEIQSMVDLRNNQ